MLGWFADPILKVLRSFLVHQLSLSKYPRFPISIKPASMIPYEAKMVRVFFIAQVGCQGPLDGHPSQHWTKPRAGQICPPSWAGPYGVIRGYFFKWDFAWGTWWWTIVNHWFKRCTLSDKPKTNPTNPRHRTWLFIQRWGSIPKKSIRTVLGPKIQKPTMILGLDHRVWCELSSPWWSNPIYYNTM